MDHETIDAASGNADEALRALAKLREALQTLPFFGGAKAIWFRDCNFMGDERTASSSAVTESLGSLAAELKEFNWQGVRLLISSGKVDKRRSFYKMLEKTGAIETFAGWSIDTEPLAGRRSRQFRGRANRSPELRRLLSVQHLPERSTRHHG